MNSRTSLCIAAMMVSFVLAEHARAAWLSDFTGNSFVTSSPPNSPFGLIDGNLSFAVYENTSGTTDDVVFNTTGGTESVSLEAGEFLYAYQMVNSGVGTTGVLTIDISVVNTLVNDVGIVDGSIFADESDGFGSRALSATGNLGLGTDGTVGSPLHVDGTGLTTEGGVTASPLAVAQEGNFVRTLFLPELAQGAVSSIFFFTSNTGPMFGDVLLNVPSGPGSVPVPVPAPPVFALLGIGLPFVVLLRKRSGRERKELMGTVEG